MSKLTFESLTRPQQRLLKRAAFQKDGHYAPCGQRGFHRVAWSLYRLGLVTLWQPTVDPIHESPDYPETCSYVRGVNLTKEGRALVPVCSECGGDLSLIGGECNACNKETDS